MKILIQVIVCFVLTNLICRIVRNKVFKDCEIDDDFLLGCQVMSLVPFVNIASLITMIVSFIIYWFFKNNRLSFYELMFGKRKK